MRGRRGGGRGREKRVRDIDRENKVSDQFFCSILNGGIGPVR